jgi:hypothetical protein
VANKFGIDLEKSFFRVSKCAERSAGDLGPLASSSRSVISTPVAWFELVLILTCMEVGNHVSKKVRLHPKETESGPFWYKCTSKYVVAYTH